MNQRRILGGLLIRKECWTLSWRARLLLLALGGLLALLVFFFSYPFLAVTQPIHGEIAVVEGWMPGYNLKKCVGLCQAGNYRKVLTTGVIRPDYLGGVSKVTYADLAAIELKRFGLTNEEIVSVPCYVENRDRTYHSALAARRWLNLNAPEVTSVDVISSGPHARRTRLLFEKALGNTVRVGIVALDCQEYDKKHWWRSSAGVRDVIGEAIAYLYARLLFYPADPARSDGRRVTPETVYLNPVNYHLA